MAEERRNFNQRNADANAALGSVRVFPANEDMLKHLRHPGRNVGFLAMDQSVEWPLDQFTKRRIRDGDVTIDDSSDASQAGRAAARAEASRAEPSSHAAHRTSQQHDRTTQRPPERKAPNPPESA